MKNRVNLSLKTRKIVSQISPNYRADGNQTCPDLHPTTPADEDQGGAKQEAQILILKTQKLTLTQLLVQMEIKMGPNNKHKQQAEKLAAELESMR